MTGIAATAQPGAFPRMGLPLHCAPQGGRLKGPGLPAAVWRRAGLPGPREWRRYLQIRHRPVTRLRTDDQTFTTGRRYNIKASFRR